MSTTRTPDRIEARPAEAVLHEIDGGRLLDDLSEMIRDTAEACQTFEKVGTVTLVVKFAPNDDGETLIVTPELKAKAPQAPRKSRTFFMGDDGLRRDNPAQGRLDGFDEDDQPRAGRIAPKDGQS
ncbi:hypothetical protein [Euzebya sp.]|uniref:hypothetical protein n=1 Tax=Euzebya sp. TaxID=1971409 RepID=UPI003515BD07